MNNQAINAQDNDTSWTTEENYEEILRNYKDQAPICHFTAMELHSCDSDPSGRSDGYQCRHCGHIKSLEEI